jgi:hypothetical protein
MAKLPAVLFQRRVGMRANRGSRDRANAEAPMRLEEAPR